MGALSGYTEEDLLMIRPPLRWGIIGTGSVSRSVVPDLASCDGVEISIVQSRDAAKAKAFAEEFGIPGFTGDFEQVLADPTVDAVYLATPFATHHPMALRALRAGKHVLVEKPIAMTAADVAELFEEAERNKVFLMEAMWMKFNPAFRHLHEQIAAGVIGEVRNMRAAFAFPFPQDGGSRWDIERSGSTLLDQGIYPVTLAHSLFGVPTEIFAAGCVRDDGVDLAEHFTLEFSQGRFAQCASGMTEFSDPSASVSGTKGWITFPALFWSTTTLEIHAGTSEDLFKSPLSFQMPREGNGYVPMLREVVAAINRGDIEHAAHPKRDTLEVFAMLDDIRARITK